jgi:hypothetical protein
MILETTKCKLETNNIIFIEKMVSVTDEDEYTAKFSGPVHTELNTAEVEKACVMTEQLTPVGAYYINVHKVVYIEPIFGPTNDTTDTYYGHKVVLEGADYVEIYDKDDLDTFMTAFKKAHDTITAHYQDNSGETPLHSESVVATEYISHVVDQPHQQGIIGDVVKVYIDNQWIIANKEDLAGWSDE